LLTSKRVHLALPVRWSLVGEEGRGTPEFACTYDIHSQGARLLGLRELSVGDQMLVERGRHKAVCQVIWIADAASALRGQFSVRCVEGRVPWDDELRQMKEQYLPIIFEHKKASPASAGAGANRRRRPRFYVEGKAEVTDGEQCVAGEVQQISEYGARISTAEIMQPGTDFRLMMNVFDINLTLKAKVKYQASDAGMGVEFQEIRRGDRPMLSYVLSRVRRRRVEDFMGAQPLSVAAG
jgi:hypothetical protein